MNLSNAINILFKVGLISSIALITSLLLLVILMILSVSNNDIISFISTIILCIVNVIAGLSGFILKICLGLGIILWITSLLI